MVKKRSPKEIIEATPRPEVEQAFIKYPRQGLVNVVGYGTATRVLNDESKVNLEYQKHERRPFMHVHTHPTNSATPEEECALPNPGDIARLLSDKRIKIMTLAVTDGKSGKLKGYALIRKTKKTPYVNFNSLYQFDGYDPKNLPGLNKESEQLYPYLARYAKLLRMNNQDLGPVRDSLKKITERYNLQYRYVPARNYRANNKKDKLILRKGLEGKVVGTTVIICLLGSIFFLSSNITGKVIGNLNQSTGNILGVIFLLLGLVGAFLWFRNRKKR